MRSVFAAIVLAVALTAPAAQAQQADATLNVSEYIARGLPAIDRDWVPADYAAAARALNDLPLEQLPRTDSAKSGAVIDRLVNRSSIAPCQNSGAELAARMQLCAPALGGISQILIRYGAAMEADISRGQDGLRLLNYSLFIAAEISEMMTAFVRTLDTSAPDYSARLAG